MCYNGSMEIIDAELVPVEGDSIIGTASSLIPYLQGDDKRASYLSFRVCGFGVGEACKLARVAYETVRRWRKRDRLFYRMDVSEMPQLRKEFAAEALSLHWIRNYRLMLYKDALILDKAITVPDEMTSQEWLYLRKIRGMYTPLQLDAIRRASDPQGPSIDTFAGLITTLREEKVSREIELRPIS